MSRVLPSDSIYAIMSLDIAEAKQSDTNHTNKLLKLVTLKSLATLKSKYIRGRRVIPPWQVINHNISMNIKEVLGDKIT
jgi:hypothetical protein